MRDFSHILTISKVKLGVLRPVQQLGSYWDRFSGLPVVGVEPDRGNSHCHWLPHLLTVFNHFSHSKVF